MYLPPIPAQEEAKNFLNVPIAVTLKQLAIQFLKRPNHPQQVPVLDHGAAAVLHGAAHLPLRIQVAGRGEAAVPVVEVPEAAGKSKGDKLILKDEFLIEFIYK